MSSEFINKDFLFLSSKIWVKVTGSSEWCFTAPVQLYQVKT